MESRNIVWKSRDRRRTLTAKWVPINQTRRPRLAGGTGSVSDPMHYASDASGVTPLRVPVDSFAGTHLSSDSGGTSDISLRGQTPIPARRMV